MKKEITGILLIIAVATLVGFCINQSCEQRGGKIAGTTLACLDSTVVK